MNNDKFEKQAGYFFKNKSLLEIALTHSSFCVEHGVKPEGDNERLEFLGDAVLDMAVSAELYRRLKSWDEGKLTKTRALIVCEKSLAVTARKLDMGKYINMGKGENLSGGRDRDSILADALEAVVGAIYLDGGYSAAAGFVARELRDIIGDAVEGRLFSDYKTEVQEILQQGGRKPDISYRVDKEEGPDHDKTFHVHLIYNERALGEGSGKSKKEAEQNAAKATLERGIGNYVF